MSWPKLSESSKFVAWRIMNVPLNNKPFLFQITTFQDLFCQKLNKTKINFKCAMRRKYRKLISGNESICICSVVKDKPCHWLLRLWAILLQKQTCFVSPSCFISGSWQAFVFSLTISFVRKWSSKGKKFLVKVLLHSLRPILPSS